MIYSQFNHTIDKDSRVKQKFLFIMYKSKVSDGKNLNTRTLKSFGERTTSYYMKFHLELVV